MSRSIKNRNIANIARGDRDYLKGDRDYGWVDGGDGFLYLREFYHTTPRDMYIARRKYQSERLYNHQTRGTPKEDRKIEMGRLRMRARQQAHEFLSGKVEDFVPTTLSEKPSWAW